MSVTVTPPVQFVQASTQLTYELRTIPSPLTVSVPGASPRLAALEFVVTNQTAASLDVTSITFTLEVGTTGADITATTSGILTQVSDTGSWAVTAPSTTVTDGAAEYVLGPVTGASVALAAGASVVVQIGQIQTVQSAGTTSIGITELIQGSSASATLSVTTFPDGFYFDGLTATVPQGSGNVPVAQVAVSTSVTLTWNCSVTNPAAYTIIYSNAANGQQTSTTSFANSWTSPELMSDTVFTVTVAATTTAGQPLTVARSTAVSVQNPELIAQTLTVNGSAAVGGLTVANGPIAMFGAGTLIASGSTIAPTSVDAVTDGFAVAQIVAPSSYDVASMQWAQIYTVGQWFSIWGGNGSYDNATQDFLYNSPSYMILPIPSGTSWQYSAHIGANTTPNATAQFWWFPIGAAPNSAVSQPASTMDLAVLGGQTDAVASVSPQGGASSRRTSAQTFIEKLSQTFNVTLEDSAKDELVKLLLSS